MKTLTFKVNAKNEEEAKQKAENMIGPAMSKMGLNGKGYKFNKVEWLQKSLFESGDGAKAVVYYTVNDSVMKDNKAKVKSYLAQEFRDLKARLSKKSFKDNKPKSQREVWLTGISSIKDSLKRFKDATPQIPEGSAAAKFCKEAIQKAKRSGKTGDALVTEAYKILMNEYPSIHPAARNYISEHINDSAINDEIVRRVDYKGCHIYIGKQGDYTYSVYTKNSMGRPLAWDTGYSSESEALEAAKKSADLIVQKFGDSAEYINDRKIEIKKDGKLIDVVNAETLDEAVRIYERQHPELRGQIDAYFSDEKVEDGFEEEWSKLMFKMKRLQMNPNTKWSEMEALNEEMNALKKKYGKNN